MTIVNCENCNKDLERVAAEIARNKTGKFFCDFRCRSLFYKLGYKVSCIVCDVGFEKNPAEQKRYPVHCCSVRCRSKFNDKRVKRQCDQCGVVFYRPPSVLKDRKHLFCTQNCFDVFQNTKTLVACEKCGKQIWKTPSAMLKDHHFCGKKCFFKFSFPESQMEVELEKLVKPLGIPYRRNDWTVLKKASCRKRDLELDFYFPTINFAIEVNGIAHYEPIYGKKALEVVQRNGKIKRRKCKELGIILRVVKPGNCKRETYMPRYKRVVWEIKKEINYGIS